MKMIKKIKNSWLELWIVCRDNKLTLDETKSLLLSNPEKIDKGIDKLLRDATVIIVSKIIIDILIKNKMKK